MFEKTYNKNKLICLGIAPCLMLNPVQGEIQKTNTEKPNVLFIIMDDMCDWVGFLGGHDQVISPNLDRLANRGIVFSNAYTAVPLSNPSRTALLTGIQPFVSGIYNNDHKISDFPIVNNSLFMPQHFKNNGYETIMSGKVFHTKPSNDVLNKMWDDKTNMDGGYGPWIVNQTLPESLQSKWNNFEAKTGPDTDFPDVRNSQKIISFINQTRNKPFFAAMGFYRPHIPYTAPKRYFDMYDVDTIRVPETIPNDLDDLPNYAKNFIKNSSYHSLLKSTGNCYQQMVRAYLACVSFADDRIGMILDALDASPYGNNTWIVLVGDNGYHLGQKERWGKTALWREACHVPFIIVPPKTNTSLQSGICKTPVSLIDIYPTLVEACNLPSVGNDQLDGNSLMPLLQNPEAQWNTPCISTYLPGNFVIHQNEWNYIRYANGSHELYNIEEDEDEFTNLAGKTEYKYMVDSLGKFLPSDWNTGIPEDTVAFVSEDISSHSWETEIARLNSTYTRPSIGNNYGLTNSSYPYFNKYMLKGAVVNTKGTPNCVIPGTTHGDAISALAFRLKNDSTSYFELPHMFNAGFMTLHLRSGYRPADGFIAVQMYDSEDWLTLATFPIKKQDAFNQVSIDEVITCPININELVKLRIRGGNRYTQIFSVDVTPYGTTANVYQHRENMFCLHGRNLTVFQPTWVAIYNALGVKMIEKQVEQEWLLPEQLGHGFFIINSMYGTKKILLREAF
ncbi:hypothetical protein MASR2M117_15470 [Paludibacter sp.]